jgi:hypothetical protein
MESRNRIPARRHILIPHILFLLMATMVVGCIDLRKPKVIEMCAATNTCSDDPNQQPRPDANEDTEEVGPDLSYEDKPTPKDVPDSPTTDTTSNPVDDGGINKDVGGTDGKDAGTSSDADSGSADSAAEVAPETNRPDEGPDLSPDLKPDLTPDLAPDLKPDLKPDLQPDLTPDASTLGTGLVVYYKCESANGTTLQDFSGNNNNGTLVGGTAGYTFPAGKVGKAIALAKAGSGYVTVPNAVFANATTITVAAWVNSTTAQSWARLFDVGVNAKLANNTSTGTKYMNLVPKNDGTNLAFAISKDGYGSEQVLSATAPTTGTWKHVAVVLGSGQATLYLDGAVAQTSSSVALRPVDLGTIDYAYLGKSQFTADPYFDGAIDEFRVYSRALSATEVQALYEFAGP